MFVIRWFLYAVDEADPEKQRVARNWRAELWKSRRGHVSFQVLENSLSTQCGSSRRRVRKRGPGSRFAGRNPVVTDAALLERGWKLQDRYRLSYWNALIVAASRVASCRYCSRKTCKLGNS